MIIADAKAQNMPAENIKRAKSAADRRGARCLL
jgi:transcriptional/translational regulatory protein YebC/TACO1